MLHIVNDIENPRHDVKRLDLLGSELLMLLSLFGSHADGKIMSGRRQLRLQINGNTCRHQAHRHLSEAASTRGTSLAAVIFSCHDDRHTGVE